jgi:hypothetical protein
VDCLTHIEAFVQSFVDRQHLERANALVHSVKGRRKLANEFLLSAQLDPRYCRIVPVKGRGQAEYILNFLRKHGAPELCVVWDLRSPDGRAVPLEEGLADVIGWTHGAVVSCIAGRLAYYEYDDTDARFFCYREDSAEKR